MNYALTIDAIFKLPKDLLLISDKYNNKILSKEIINKYNLNDLKVIIYNRLYPISQFLNHKFFKKITK